VSNIPPLSPGESRLIQAALRSNLSSFLAAHGDLLSAAARTKEWSVETIANQALLSGAIKPNDPRVEVMASPIARAAVGIEVGLADGAARCLSERLSDPTEAARQAARILAEAERGATGADRAALRGGRLGLENLARIGGRRAAAGLGAAAPIVEQAGLILANKNPDLAAEAFGLACAFVEAERSARERVIGKDSQKVC